MSPNAGLRDVAATRYVTPLREGGSLPGLLEADDDGLYVTKFRGAGQGVLALVAEVIVGELARRLGLLVPELVTVEIDPALAAAEPDPEIQELIAASAGANLGVDFLPGALSYSPAGPWQPERAARRRDRLARRARHQRRPQRAQPEPAAVARPAVADRSRRRALPAAPGPDPAEHADRPFPQIAEHVLLPHAGSIPDAHRAAGAAGRRGAAPGGRRRSCPPDWTDARGRTRLRRIPE